MTPYDHLPPVFPPSGEPGSVDTPALKYTASQKRKRNRRWPIALTEAEEAAALKAAADAELSKMAYGRAMLLGSPGPRARRKPHVNAQALGRATTALNRLGNNFNQIAHVLNAGAAFSLAAQFNAALADVRRTLQVIREAAAGRGDFLDDNQGQSPR